MKKILTADGYKKNRQGFYAKHGKEIKFSIEDPIAYSDYYADAQLMSSELKSEGIDATVYGVQASQWYTDSADGDFTSIEHWGNGGTNPYTQYDNWLDYTTSAPIGKSAAADYGRYHNAAVQADLAKLAGTDPTTRRPWQRRRCPWRRSSRPNCRSSRCSTAPRGASTRRPTTRASQRRRIRTWIRRPVTPNRRTS